MNKQQLLEKAYTFEYLQKINFILKKIRLNDSGMFATKTKEEEEEEKKNPDLPKKITVDKVEFPDTGGIRTHFSNTLPINGYPDGDTVERVDEAKKMVMRMMWELHHMPKWRLLFLLPTLKVIMSSWIISYWEYIKKYRFKTIRYCRTVRELYRVFDKLNPSKDREEGSDLWDMIRDDFCLTMEADDAYKYRFQIVFVHLNKDNLKKDAIKEVRRLLKLLADREEGESMKEKWGMFSKYLFLLKFRPKILKTLVAFLNELDLEELKMDDSDIVHAQTKVLFNWGQ